MELGMTFGRGFALGFVFALNLSRFLWPDYDESVWDRRIREKEIADNAVKEYKAKRKERKN